MDTSTLLRQQIKEAHEWLEATMADVTPQQAHWQPAGKANPIAACYGHIVLSEDWLINTLFQGKPPFAATTFAGKTGFSDMPPQGPWFDWGRKVKVDLTAARRFAQAVYDNTDKYLASVKDADLARQLDSPAGRQTVQWLLTNGSLGHVHQFTGEISCLKGLQGAKGYPA